MWCFAIVLSKQFYSLIALNLSAPQRNFSPRRDTVSIPMSIKCSWLPGSGRSPRCDDAAIGARDFGCIREGCATSPGLMREDCGAAPNRGTFTVRREDE